MKIPKGLKLKPNSLNCFLSSIESLFSRKSSSFLKENIRVFIPKSKRLFT
jgi:hypothetical protein